MSSCRRKKVNKQFHKCTECPFLAKGFLRLAEDMARSCEETSRELAALKKDLQAVKGIVGGGSKKQGREK